MSDTMKPTLPLEEWFSHETVQRLIDEAYAAGLEDAEKTCDEQYYKHIGPAYSDVRYGITACSASIRALKPKGEA